MPVDKLKPGESEEDYLAYCIPAEIKAGYDRDQAAAICYQQLSINLTADKQWRKDFLAFKPESTCLKHYTHKPSEEYRKG
jgi:hypothetical protein